MCLLYETNKGKDSPWYPYLLNLPRNYTILASFGDFEKQALQVLSLLFFLHHSLFYSMLYPNLAKYLLLRWIMLSGLQKKLFLKLNMTGNKPLLSSRNLSLSLDFCLSGLGFGLLEL